jgi:hypothetical protein
MFNKFAKTIIVSTLLLVPASVAFASSDSVSAEQEAKIRSTLTEQGYEVRKVKMEDGMFEAYAIKDGKKVELYLDNDLKVVKTKSND